MTGTITKTILAVCLGLMCALQLAAADLLLDAKVTWGIRLIDQGKGIIERNSSDNSYLIKKDSAAGMVFLVAEKPLPLEAGKAYELAVKFKTGGTAKASIMFSIDGRKSFPQSAPVNTNNKTVFKKVSFTAQPGESGGTAVIVLSGGIGSLDVEMVDFHEMNANDQNNLLANPEIEWGYRQGDGGSGKMNILDNQQYELDKNDASGYLFLVNEKDLPITPGKNYRVTVTFTVSDNKCNGSLMLSMPGDKRTPFPTSSSLSPTDKPASVALDFTAGQNEKLLRIHFVLKGIGKAVISRVEFKEVTEAEIAAEAQKKNLRSFDCRREELERYWKPVAQRSFNATADMLEAEILPNGGFICESIDWPAARIKTLEIKFRAFDEGGFVRLDFETSYNGKALSGYQTMSCVPDGQWHSLRFPVSEDLAWRGQVTRLKISWMSMAACRVGLERIRALTQDNLITDADNIPAQTPAKIELIRPRGNYRLSYQGSKNPGLTLTLSDRNSKTIKKVELPAGRDDIEFTSPELTASGILTVAEKNSGYPRLELLSLPMLDKPAAGWQGYWIWSRNNTGPMDSKVWFKRSFEIPSEIQEAALLATGDDACALIINGKELLITGDWTQPRLLDVAKYLKPGSNEIIIKVHNYAAWGGALLNLYARTVNGQEVTINTDEQWKCHEGGDTIPAKIEDKVFLIGQVPCTPWGNRVPYYYVGPKGKIAIIPGVENNFTVKVSSRPAIDTDRLDFLLKMPDGSERKLQGGITPSTGKWAPGTEIKVKYEIAEQVANKSGEAVVSLDSRLLEITGSSTIGKVIVSPETPRPLSNMRITGAGERPWFVINGKKSPPIYYDLPGSFIDAPYQRDYLVKNTVKAGISVIRMPMPMLKKTWPARNTFDFTSLDRAMEVIMLNSPKANVILVTPNYMPEWWLAENPGHKTTYYGNLSRNPNDDFQSLASDKWLKDLNVFYKNLADHIKVSAYAGKIVGIAPTDGTTWEWMWSHGRGHHGRAYSGWSPADIEAYRHYLQNKYQTDANLSAAWNQSGATLAKAMPPVPERLDSASVINMLDPSKDMDLIDFYIFRNETIADDIIAICRMIKEISDGNWIAGSYYGYLITFSHMYWHLQDGGHLRLSKVARSPYVDFVFGPTLYHWRRLGLAESPMQPAEAVSSHGKLDIGELDIRTFSEPGHHESINGKTNTVEQSVGAMNRSFCMLLTRGMGGHWMEMYETWYREPVILDLIKSQNDLYRSLPEKPIGTTPREVCIVSDEDSAFYVKNHMGDGIHNILVAEVMRLIPEAGFAFRHVLLKDLLEPGVIPPQKLYIITNLMVLDKAARQTLLERFRKEKAQVVWLYAPGAFYPDQGPSAANIEQLLGLKFAMLDKKVTLSMQMKTDRLGAREIKNYIQTGPWFLPVSGYDELLAVTPDEKPAMVSWQKDNVKNYFSAVPNLPPAMFRAIAKQAGVWCYADGSDPVYAGNDFVAIHVKSGGRKSLNIPAGLKAKAVIGPLQGYFKSGQTWDAIPGSTYGFLLEKE